MIELKSISVIKNVNCTLHTNKIGNFGNNVDLRDSTVLNNLNSIFGFKPKPHITKPQA